MNIIEGPEFQKEFKKLLKKYRTLNDDIAIAKLAITAAPKGNGTKHWAVLTQQDDVYVLKMRMMCRAVRGADFRLVYTYDGNTVEVVFIEIYFKGDKAREDIARYKEYL